MGNTGSDAEVVEYGVMQVAQQQTHETAIFVMPGIIVFNYLCNYQ